MAKRSDFVRKENDWYPTPRKETAKLVEHLRQIGVLDNRPVFIEPCAGDGVLARDAEELSGGALRCAGRYDLHPRHETVIQYDALHLTREHVADVHMFITNPPWPSGPRRDGEPTLGIIRHLAALRPTWMILSADMASNRYFGEIQPMCSHILPVGRVIWEQNGKAGKDNAAWYRFCALNTEPTIWLPRTFVSDKRIAA